MAMAGNGGVGDATTWHRGLVARWWALFRRDGPEIEFFRRHVEAAQPALDVGCGNGRLLVPYVRDGLDVDGVDASADMIEHCRAAAAAVGASPGLHVQPVHELDLPRRYATVLMCGTFGVGTVGRQDRVGLERIAAHLVPGGRVVFDYETADGWTPAPTDAADDEPPPPAERRRGTDGRQVRREMRAWRWHDGELLGDERHELTYVVHRPAEIVELLRATGFVDVSVVGGYDGAAPSPRHQFLVYSGVRPS